MAYIVKKIVLKLGELRSFLNTVNIVDFGNLNIKRNNILNEILDLDKTSELRNLTSKENFKLNVLKTELNKLTDQKEIMWRQRSRVQWISKGDKNSNFHRNVMVENVKIT